MSFRKLLIAVFLFSGLTAGACEIDMQRILFSMYMNGYPSNGMFFQHNYFPLQSSFSFQAERFQPVSFFRPRVQMRSGMNTVYDYHFRSDAVFCRMEAHTQRKYGVMIRVRTGGY